jgi:hypothetical protein
MVVEQQERFVNDEAMRMMQLKVMDVVHDNYYEVQELMKNNDDDYHLFLHS